MKPKLSSNLILRVDEELKRRLADVQSQTDIRFRKSCASA